MMQTVVLVKTLAHPRKSEMNIEWKSSGHTSALVVCDSVKVFQKELRNHSSKGNKDKSTTLLAT